jgi:hypothetical protein
MDATIALISGETIHIKDVLMMSAQGSFLVITAGKEADSFVRLEEIRFALHGDHRVTTLYPGDKKEN